jgi:periplasmic protein TonB
MKSVLSQGLWGKNRAELAPSVNALGPNRYLTRGDFLKMLALAILLHALAFGIAALAPRDTVTDIPVRALSFRLGGSPQMPSSQPVAVPAASTPAPVAPPVMQAASTDSWSATDEEPPSELPEPLKPMVKPAPQPKTPRVTPQTELPAAYQPAAATPAIAPTPQQYVREVGGAPGGTAGAKASETTMTEQTMQAIRSRYEQEISGWIERHKFYPAEASGREGRAIVRVRIDRAGNVRYYAIEQSTGLAVLDNAALDMIRRANPVPGVPTNYPAGNLVEFLIPISFKAPHD